MRISAGMIRHEAAELEELNQIVTLETENAP